MIRARHAEEPPSRAALLRRGLRLEYMTLAWNIVAGSGAVAIGLATASLALLAFGLDVAIDSLASAVLVWRFVLELRGAEQREHVERHAARIVGMTLLLAGFYIVAQATRALLMHIEVEASSVGDSIAVISLLILPPLAYGKIRLAAQLESNALRGDGVLTAVGASLAAGTLLGLLVDTVLGWWWADPIAALLIAGVLLREGWQVLHASPQARAR